TMDRRAIAIASVPSAFVLASAVLARYLALGTLGGYQRRLFAFVNNHVLMWHENKSWEPDSILAAAWSHSVNPISVTGAPQLFSGRGETAFGILIACWIGWIGVVRPLLRRHEPRSRVSLGLAAWVAGSLAIVVLSQTWFWRQAYSVVLPLGMLVAYELGPAIE